MWLLGMHIVISILCFVAIVRIANTYKAEIVANGWLEGVKGRWTSLLYILIPVFNILMIFAVMMMTSVKKEDFDRWIKENSNDRERF